MQCKKCGTALSETDKFCKVCGEPVQVVNNSQNNNLMNQQVGNQSINKMYNDNKKLEEKKKGDRLALISLMLYILAPVFSKLLDFLPKELSTYISSIVGLFPIAGIVTLIVGIVKYPENKFLKIVMLILVTLLILGMIAIAVFTIFCYFTCSNMNTSGCS